jgi:hypothetical protein
LMNLKTLEMLLHQSFHQHFFQQHRILNQTRLSWSPRIRRSLHHFKTHHAANKRKCGNAPAILVLWEKRVFFAWIASDQMHSHCLTFTQRLRSLGTALIPLRCARHLFLTQVVCHLNGCIISWWRHEGYWPQWLRWL